MVRGHAKEVSQQKNAAKQAAKEKSQKRDSSATKAIKDAGVAVTCSVCMQPMPSTAVYRAHFAAKHPKATLPPQLGESA